MPATYRPSSDALIGANWTTLPPGGNAFAVLDDPFGAIGINERDLLVHSVGGGGGTGADIFLLRFPTPGASLDFTDGTLGSAPLVGSDGVILRFRIRPLFTGTNVPMDFQIRHGATTIATGAFTLDAGAFVSGAIPPWREHSLTLTTDPIHGGTWTPANLALTSFGLSKTAAAGNTIQIAACELVVDEREAVGGARARLAPDLGEPALFCAICSFPFHRSRLIRVSNPDHPHYNLLVCSDDLDIYERLTDQEPALTEGDIDFDAK